MNNNTSNTITTFQNNTADLVWTTEALIDELFLCLAGVKEIITNQEKNGKRVTVRKYYSQARDLMKWIPIAKPSPPFIIYLSDLTPQIKNEFKQLAVSTLQYVLKQAVGRLFENLDFKGYHLSIARSLTARLEE